MPESVRDRPTKSHEYIFLLTKSADYFYDQEAIKEQAIVEPRPRLRPNGAATYEKFGFDTGCGVSTNGTRNRRSVWTIPTQPFPEAHFATYPEKLVEPCIKAGTSEAGCCLACGAPYMRLVELGRVTSVGGSKTGGRATHLEIVSPVGQTPNNAYNTGEFKAHEHITLGFRPSCACAAGEPASCIILDPFGGAGTTALVAKKLGRGYVSLDLSAEYCQMAERRVAKVLL